MLGGRHGSGPVTRVVVNSQVPGTEQPYRLIVPAGRFNEPALPAAILDFQTVDDDLERFREGLVVPHHKADFASLGPKAKAVEQLFARRTTGNPHSDSHTALL